MNSEKAHWHEGCGCLGTSPTQLQIWSTGRGRQRNVPKCKTHVHLMYSARAGRAEPLFTSNLVNSRRCQDEDGKGMCQNAKRTCI